MQVREVGVGAGGTGVAKRMRISHLSTVTMAAQARLSQSNMPTTPWELSVAETQQTLVANNLPLRIVLRMDGGMRRCDIALTAILGAAKFSFSNAALIVTGCAYIRPCHLNKCPVGGAIWDEKFRGKYKGPLGWPRNH